MDSRAKLYSCKNLPRTIVLLLESGVSAAGDRAPALGHWKSGTCKVCSPTSSSVPWNATGPDAPCVHDPLNEVSGAKPYDPSALLTGEVPTIVLSISSIPSPKPPNLKGLLS